MGSAPRTHVLIVDDEAPLVDALCRTLQSEGYATLGLNSPRQALAAVGAQRFDLLLVDLMMPEMDGIELLRAAHQLDPQLVGIMMTGHGTIDTAVAALQAGALDYILKPFDLNGILPVLARALTVRRLRLENAALLERVAERTADLETAVAELKATNKELDAFVHTVSHDLRAPLRSIAGFAEVLREDYASAWPAEARAHLETISVNVRRTNDLIEDLLRFSRLTHQPLDKQLLRMTDLFQDVVRETRAGEPGRAVTVILPDLPEAFADPVLLRQVVVNLVSNALKFTRHRRDACIEIAGERTARETIFCVADNGAGFDMAHAAKLFNVFERLHRQGEFEGSGIGLSIVQRIVERHGGRVWAEGEPERSARFWFSLPAK